MKKKILSLILVVLMVGTVIGTAAAETYYGDPGWQVTFNGSALVSNFTSTDIAEAIAEMQPGDNTIFTVNLYNNVSNDVRWYMTNATLYSLEDRSANSATEGGAYTYYLTYTDASGATTVLFDSDTVGGEAVSPAGEGLHEATDAMEEYFFLDDLASQASGVIRLEVKLDGEVSSSPDSNDDADPEKSESTANDPEEFGIASRMILIFKNLNSYITCKSLIK